MNNADIRGPLLVRPSLVKRMRAAHVDILEDLSDGILEGNGR